MTRTKRTSGLVALTDRRIISGGESAPPRAAHTDTAESYPTRPLKRLRSTPRDTAHSIFAAISDVIGSVSGNGGLPIPQLLQMIAEYAESFITSKNERYLIDSTMDANRITPCCAIDNEWMIGCGVGVCFYKFSIRGGE